VSAERIRELNDTARRTFTGCAVLITSGVEALDTPHRARLLAKVRNFEAFEEGNDPHGEHDFGAIETEEGRFFFKFDYYDPSMSSGSEDPADEERTQRVLTIMRAEEY
jgi:hypothetical protein